MEMKYNWVISLSALLKRIAIHMPFIKFNNPNYSIEFKILKINLDNISSLVILGSVDTETFWEFILNLNRSNRGSLYCKLIISFFHVQSILSRFTNVLFKHAFSQFVQFAPGKKDIFGDGEENMLLYCFFLLVVTIVKYNKSNYFHPFTFTLGFGLFFFNFQIV